MILIVEKGLNAPPISAYKDNLPKEVPILLSFNVNRNLGFANVFMDASETMICCEFELDEFIGQFANLVPAIGVVFNGNENAKVYCIGLVESNVDPSIKSILGQFSDSEYKKLLEIIKA
jgi:hypothetical protein